MPHSLYSGTKSPCVVRLARIGAKKPLRLAWNRARLMKIAALTVLLFAGSALVTQLSLAQTTQQLAAPTGENAAAGHMAFEVASIHLAKPGTFLRPSFSFDIDNTSIPPGGRFFADFPLATYIEFAYKMPIVLPREQQYAMLAGLPKWVRTDRFVIQAEAPGNPTKDQMRLMLQSLLADRFKLKLHFESPIEPVFALVPIKRGKLGPRIQSHSRGLPCDAKWTPPPDRTSPSVPPGGFMLTCNRIQAIDAPNQTVMLGARNVTMEQVAEYLSAVGGFSRPVINESGLSGRIDFTLQWTPARRDPSASAANAQADMTGPDLIEALQEQFGMKLKAMKSPIRTLVIDHVERPSPN